MEETARKIKENTSCWYAVYTAPRAEKKVKEQLDKIGVENYLPLQPVVRLWNNRKKKIFIPVVPGCLFVHISSEEIAPCSRYSWSSFFTEGKGTICFYTGSSNGDFQDYDRALLRTGRVCAK